MSEIRRVPRETSARALARLTVESEKVLRVRAFALRDEISSTLERAAVGRGVFYKGNRNPSAQSPDPPARQTGRLLNSIDAARVTPTLYEVGPRSAAFANVKPDSQGRLYPEILEFGTRSRSPFPYIRPSVASFKAKLR